MIVGKTEYLSQKCARRQILGIAAVCAQANDLIALSGCANRKIPQNGKRRNISRMMREEHLNTNTAIPYNNRIPSTTNMPYEKSRIYTVSQPSLEGYGFAHGTVSDISRTPSLTDNITFDII